MNSPKLRLDTRDLLAQFETATMDIPIMDHAGEYVLEMLIEHLVNHGKAFSLQQPVIGDIYSIVPRTDISLTMDQTTRLQAAIDVLGRGVLSQFEDIGIYTDTFDYYPSMFYRGDMVLNKF